MNTQESLADQILRCQSLAQVFPLVLQVSSVPKVLAAMTPEVMEKIDALHQQLFTTPKANEKKKEEAANPFKKYAYIFGLLAMGDIDTGLQSWLRYSDRAGIDVCTMMSTAGRQYLFDFTRRKLVKVPKVGTTLSIERREINFAGVTWYIVSSLIKTEASGTVTKLPVPVRYKSWHKKCANYSALNGWSDGEIYPAPPNRRDLWAAQRIEKRLCWTPTGTREIIDQVWPIELQKIPIFPWLKRFHPDNWVLNKEMKWVPSSKPLPVLEEGMFEEGQNIYWTCTIMEDHGLHVLSGDDVLANLPHQAQGLSSADQATLSSLVEEWLEEGERISVIESILAMEGDQVNAAAAAAQEAAAAATIGFQDFSPQPPPQEMEDFDESFFLPAAAQPPQAHTPAPVAIPHCYPPADDESFYLPTQQQQQQQQPQQYVPSLDDFDESYFLPTPPPQPQEMDDEPPILSPQYIQL